MRIVDSPDSKWKLAGSFAGDDAKRAVRIYRSQEQDNGRRAIAKSDVFAGGDLHIDRWPLVLNLSCEGDSLDQQSAKQ